MTEDVSCCQLYKTPNKQKIGSGMQSTVYAIEGYPKYALKVIPLRKETSKGVWGKPLIGGGSISKQELAKLIERMKLLHKHQIGTKVYCSETCNGSLGHVAIITIDRIYGKTLHDIAMKRSRSKKTKRKELYNYLTKEEKHIFNNLKTQVEKILFQGSPLLSDFHLDNIMYGHLHGDTKNRYWVVDF